MRTQFKLDHAESKNNGIYFYSERHNGYVAIATVDEQGLITTEWTTTRQRNKQEKVSAKKNFFKRLVFVLPSMVILFILSEWAMTKDIIYGIRVFLLGYALILLSSFIISTNRIKKSEENSFRFHAAEHMALNAYKVLRRVPTLEEIALYSKFDNFCGTNMTTLMVMCFILMFACTFISNPLYMFIGMLSSVIIVCILLNLGMLNFLQKFSTIDATERELKVAIAELTVWFENEQKEKETSEFSNFLHQLFPKVFH